MEELVACVKMADVLKPAKSAADKLLAAMSETGTNHRYVQCSTYVWPSLELCQNLSLQLLPL